MAQPSVTPRVHHAPPPRRHPGKVRRKVRSIWQEAPLWVHILIIAVAALLAAGVVFASVNWPYRHRKIRPMLEDVLTSNVTFSKFHRVYFPHPGFVATGVTIRRKTAPPGAPPLGHIDTLVFEGTWSDLIRLRHRVELIDITGFHIIVPAIGSNENRVSFPQGSSKEFSGPDTMIGRLVVHNSLLEVREKSGDKLLFRIKQVELRNLHKGEAMTYAIDMQNAFPTGHIRAHGSFGPINGKVFEETPVSGNFAYTEVNLHEVGDIGGRLDSRGMFKGNLRSMHVETNAETKNFAVTDGKPTPISGTMQCTLYSSNGDLDIQSLDLKTGRTGIHASGSIKGDGDKKTNLDVSVDNGRAEDLMRPFIHDKVPIAGPVWLKTHAYLGPPGDGFMQKLRMDGGFEVPSEKITDAKTEKSLSDFSKRALGKNPPDTGVKIDDRSAESGNAVLSFLKGPAKIQNGVVTTSGLTFKVAGAEALLHGTFRFHDEAVHLTGNLKMDTDISHTATGFKAALLKVIAPFFKKKSAGAVVPIAITGKDGHYHVAQNISHTK